MRSINLALSAVLGLGFTLGLGVWTLGINLLEALNVRGLTATLVSTCPALILTVWLAFTVTQGPRSRRPHSAIRDRISQLCLGFGNISAVACTIYVLVRTDGEVNPLTMGILVLLVGWVCFPQWVAGWILA